MGVFTKVSAFNDWIKEQTTAPMAPANPAVMPIDQSSGESEPKKWTGNFEKGGNRIDPALSLGCQNSLVRTQKPNWMKAIGGQISDKGSHPWTVQLSICGASGCWPCAGSIVEDQWVLTAAHCIADANMIHVDIGQWNRLHADAGEFRLSAKSWTAHPDAGKINGISSDIGLVEIPSLEENQPNSCD